MYAVVECIPRSNRSFASAPSNASRKKATSRLVETRHASTYRLIPQSGTIATQSAKNKAYGDRAHDHAESLAEAVVNDVPGHSRHDVGPYFFLRYASGQ